MNRRLARALRSGALAALWVAWAQSLLLLPIAASLPEVGHHHPSAAPEHLHTFEELGVLGLPSVAATSAPTPAPAAATASQPRLDAVLSARHSRWPLGRAPPAAAITALS